LEPNLDRVTARLLCGGFLQEREGIFMEWPAPPSGKVVSPEAQTEEWIMKIAVLGVDLGKNVCSSVGFDEVGAVVLRRRSRRDTLIDFVGKLPPCIVAMEACCGAHHLGRLFAARGHDVRLMARNTCGRRTKIVTPRG
jgi:transposase